jgi:hypothetical protein
MYLRAWRPAPPQGDFQVVGRRRVVKRQCKRPRLAAGSPARGLPSGRTKESRQAPMQTSAIGGRLPRKGTSKWSDEGESPSANAKWWARQDSNLKPDGYEPSALTIELQARRPPHNRLRLPPRARTKICRRLLWAQGLPSLPRHTVGYIGPCKDVRKIKVSPT